MKHGLIISSALTVVLASCATVPGNNGFDAVSERVTQSGLTAPVWPGVTLDDAEADARIQALQGAALTEETAIELALLNNRGL
ncbi:MAG: hypothetical protein AAFO74_17135, partial [Pseudomonadota bacterium]